MPESNDYSYSQAIVENNKKNFEQQDVDSLKTSVLAELNSLESAIWKKPEWRGWDKAKLDEAKKYLGNDFYKIDTKNNKVTFNLNNVLSYLNVIANRLSKKGIRYVDQKDEKIFGGTVLAIQIALESLASDPRNPKTYDVGPIDGKLSPETEAAIRKFQWDKGLRWVDWKPWGETVKTIVRALETLKRNKAEYSKVRGVVKDAIWTNGIWILDPNLKANQITDYLLKWKLWRPETPEEKELENLINRLSDEIKSPFNGKFRELLKQIKENGKLNTLNEDPEFKNTNFDNYIVQFSKKYSDNHKVDPALIKLIMKQESRFNPRVTWPAPTRAKWLMQLAPITIAQLRKDWMQITNKDAYTPSKNIEGGVKIFSSNLDLYDWNIKFAVAAYNAGTGRIRWIIRRVVEQYKVTKDELFKNYDLFDKYIKPRLPKQTRAYVNKIVWKYETLSA